VLTAKPTTINQNCRYVARPAQQARQAICSGVVSYLFTFYLLLTIPVRPIISKSTGTIFVKFAVAVEISFFSIPRFLLSLSTEVSSFQ